MKCYIFKSQQLHKAAKKVKIQLGAISAALNVNVLNARKYVKNLQKHNIVVTMYGMFQSQAWTHKETHTYKPYKQAEKGQLLTGPRLIRTQFHNFFRSFFGSKRKRTKTKSEDHRKKHVKLNDSVESKRSMQERKRMTS